VAVLDSLAAALAAAASVLDFLAAALVSAAAVLDSLAAALAAAEADLDSVGDFLPFFDAADAGAGAGVEDGACGGGGGAVTLKLVVTSLAAP